MRRIIFSYFVDWLIQCCLWQDWVPCSWAVFASLVPLALCIPCAWPVKVPCPVHSALVSRDYFQNNMAGSEDRGPSDDNSEAEWSDFSSNSSTTNTLDSLPFSLRSLDPIFVLNTIISCFPRQSDSSAALSASDRAPNTSGTNDRFRKFSYYLSV